VQLASARLTAPQLASARLTAAHMTCSDNLQENTDCQDADVSDKNRLIRKSTELNNIASHHVGGLNSTNKRDSSSQRSSLDDSVKPSAVVTNTRACTLETGADVLSSADRVLCNDEAVLTTCSTEQHHSLTKLAVQTSDTLTVSASDTRSSESSAGSPTLQVSSVKPSTLQTPSGDSASLVKTTSSSVVELSSTLATDTACSSDVVRQASDTVSRARVSHVTAPAQLAGKLTLTQLSELSTSSIMTEILDKLTSASSEQLLGNTMSTVSPVVVTVEQNHYTEANKSSLLFTGATETAAATLTGTTATLTDSVSCLTSLVVQDKSKPDESNDKVKAASVSKKRPRRVSTKISVEPPDSAETEEKHTKCAKLDETLVSSSAAQPPVGHKDVLSAVKVLTGLSDSQRVSCYKTVGAREERKRMIGLKAAERLRRKSLPAERVAAVGDVDRSMSDNLKSSGSSVISPTKPARRVSLVTVSTNLPVTPTVFTLRSRARLAQLKKNEALCRSQENVESQACLVEHGIQMKSLTETAAVGECIQTVTSSGMNSADVDDTVQPRVSDEAVRYKPHKHQSRSSEKPNSVLTSLTASAPVVCNLETSKTSKPGFAATSSADVNNRSTMSGKLSKLVSTSVTGKTTSAHKAVDVTSSKPENDRNVADSGGKTAVAPASKQQSNIGTRSARRSCQSGSSETVTSGSVEDNPRNSLSYREPCAKIASRDKKSNVKSVTEQTSTSSKNTLSSHVQQESLKPLQAVRDNSVKLDHNKRKVLQKETVPCTVAENTVAKVAKDVESDKSLNSERRHNQTSSSRGISVEHVNTAKQQAAVTVQDSVAVATSQPSKPADTSVICNKSPASAAPNKYVTTQEVDTTINRHKVIRRTSTRTDTFISTASEKQEWVKYKPTTPIQQINVSFDSGLAAKNSSPLTGLSLSRKQSVDLFDVAIAGTPAQYCADDSSDSLLSSPFNVDMVNEGIDSAHEAAAADNADFVIPENPAAESVDASLFGKCAVDACISNLNLLILNLILAFYLQIILYYIITASATVTLLVRWILFFKHFIKFWQISRNDFC